MDGNMNNGFQDPNAGFQNNQQDLGNAGFAQDPNQAAGFAQDPNQAAGFANTGYYDPNAAYQQQNFQQPDFQQQGFQQPGFQQAGYQQAGFQATHDWGSTPAGGQRSMKGIPAMICGLCSLGFFWLGFTVAFFIPAALGVVGIVLGSQAIKANGQDTKGKVGLITGIIGIVLPILIFTIACSVGIAEALK